MKHLKLAVLEARWANSKEWSVRPYYETLASIFCGNPNGYHYEMFNNAASLKESLPGVAGTQGIKNIVIASHGDERGIVGARDNDISRAILSNAIFQIEKNIEGIFFAGCEVGHAENAKFLFHDFHDPGGIRLQWLAGYDKRVNWLRAAAFELLFWTVYFQELGKGGGPIVRIERVCKKVRKLAGGLIDDLGAGLFVRGAGYKPGTGAPRRVDDLLH